MSNDQIKQFEKLFEDLNYLQNNSRANKISTFKDDTAGFQKEATLDKEADFAGALNWLGDVFTNLGSKVDKQSIAKAEEAAAKVYQKLGQQIASAKSAKEIALAEKELAAFSKKFPANSKAGELAQKLYTNLAKKLPQAAEGVSAAKNSGLVKAIMDKFLKGGIKSPKFLSAIKPALMKLSPTVLKKLGGLALKPMIASLGAIPGMQWIWIALGAKGLMDLGFDAAEYLQERGQKKDQDALGSDSALLIAKLFTRNGSPAPDMSKQLELIKEFQKTYEFAMDAGKASEAEATDQALAYIARMNNLKPMTATELRAKKNKAPGDAASAQPSTQPQAGKLSGQQELDTWRVLKNKALELFNVGNTDPMKLRQLLLDEVGTKMFVPLATKSYIFTPRMIFAEKTVQELQKEYALSVLNNPKSYNNIMTEIKATTVTDEQWKQVAPSVATPAAGEEVHTVLQGETLSGIAKSRLGDMNRWKEIQQLNPEITDPNKIFVGQKLKLPTGAKAPAVQPVSTEKKEKPAPAPVKQEPAKQQATPAKQEVAPPAKQEPTKKNEFVDNYKKNVEELVTEVQLGETGGAQSQALADSVKTFAETGNMRSYLTALQYLNKKSTRDVDVLQQVETASPSGFKDIYIRDLAVNYMKKTKFQESDWQDLATLEKFFGFEGGVPKSKRAQQYAKDLGTLRKFVHRKSQQTGK